MRGTDHAITSIRRLDSGYWHIRGEGPENWAQPPLWPCDEETLRAHVPKGACEDFIRAALASRPELERDSPDDWLEP